MLIGLVGSNSFIGNNISQYARQTGHEIFTLSSRFSKHLPHDYNTLLKADAVILNGWPFGESDFATLNWIDLATKLIGDLRFYNPKCQIICFGTCLEVGSVDDVLISESTLTSGISSYGKYKAFFLNNLISKGYLQVDGGDLVWIRIFGPTGRYEKSTRLFPSLSLSARREEDLLLNMPNVVRDYYSIDFFCEYLFRILSSDFKGIINVGAGRGISNFLVATSFSETNTKNLNVIMNQSSVDRLPFSSTSRIANNEKLIEEFGYIQIETVVDLANYHSRKDIQSSYRLV